MKKFVLKFLLCLAPALFGLPQLQAFHIVGGELTYECFGGSTYRINLWVYRDGNTTGAAFDDPAYIFVFDEFGGFVDKLTVGFSGFDVVDPPTDICVETLPDVVVEVALYSTVITLANPNVGYTFVYQRYSRNATIVNLVMPDQTGSSYTVDIPPPSEAVCNNSPVFNNFPPTIICANVPISFDHSATEIDGDSLVYELCDPLIGGDDNCPQPGGPAPCPAVTPPPPYPEVTWAFGYDAENPLNGNPELAIDPQTGLLTGTPTALGQYVVGICVTEYRNGIPINTVRRDFQFNVTDCDVVIAQVQNSGTTAAGEFLITNCEDDFTVQFINTSIGATNYGWEFGDPASGAGNFSTLTTPFHTYPDTGTYHIILIANSDFASCADTANIILKLYPVLAPDFEYVTECPNVPIQFISTSTNTYGAIDLWEWNFGDGGTATGQNPSHAFATGGTHAITLRNTTTLGCDVSATLNVEVLQSPHANFDYEIGCYGIPVQFTDITDSGTATSWSWNFGDPASGSNSSSQQNPEHLYLTPGVYTVSLNIVGDNGCPDGVVKTFEIYEAFDAEIAPPDEICPDDSTMLQIVDEFEWLGFNWEPAEHLSDAGSPNPYASPPTTTTYSVTVSDPNGCLHTAQTQLIVNSAPGLVDAGEDTDICLGDPVTLTPNFSPDVVSVEWQPLGDNNFNPTLNLDTTTTLIVTATTINGCLLNDTITITVNEPIDVQAEGSADFCEGESVQLLAIAPEATDFVWSPAQGLSDANVASPIASPSQTTVYTLTAFNACFEDTASVVVNVHPLPVLDAGDDETINIGESVQLNASGSGGSLAWTPSEGLDATDIANPIASPFSPTTYYVTETSEFGCNATDSLRVEVTYEFDLSIPNAFSPNGDNINDSFGIVSTRGIKGILEFSIYTRWGEKVFETSDAEVGWDGFFNNREQEIGVYVYYIRAQTYLDTQLLWKGNVTLIR